MFVIIFETSHSLAKDLEISIKPNEFKLLTISKTVLEERILMFRSLISKDFIVRASTKLFSFEALFRLFQ